MLKWTFATLAYAFLFYELINFKHYGSLIKNLQHVGVERYWFVIGVLLLLPVSLLIESVKWKLLTEKIEKISILTAFKSVLAGVSTGFFTPNRLGDFAGRIMYLLPENRRQGAILSLFGGLTQSIVILTFGIPAFLFFIQKTNLIFVNNQMSYLLIICLLLILIIIFYFLFPNFAKFSRVNKINVFFGHLAKISKKHLFSILCVTTVRFLIFCLQYFLILRFWGINLSLIYSITGICVNYLFITFTPSFSFSEVAVRGSSAMLVFGVFTLQTANLAFCGISIWLINTMLPVIFGTFFIIKKKN